MDIIWTCIAIALLIYFIIALLLMFLYFIWMWEKGDSPLYTMYIFLGCLLWLPLLIKDIKESISDGRG